MPATVTIIDPTAQGFYDSANWQAGGAYSKPTAVSDTSDSTVVQGNPDNESYVFGDIPVPGGSLVSQVKVFGRYVGQDTDGSYKFLWRLNGVDLFSTLTSFLGTGGVVVSGTFTLKPGGGTPTIFDINASEFGPWVNYATNRPSLRKLWAEITYDPISLELERVRVKETHRLLQRRQARSLVYITAPLALADVELLTLMPVSHKDGASIDDLGWGEKTWQRRHTRLLSSVLDLKTMTVKMVAQDWRPLIVALYDEGRTLISSSSFANGIGRIFVGTRTFNRDSKAWVQDPSDGVVREVAYDIEQLAANEILDPVTLDDGGQLLEDASTNELTRSSFVSGTTGITLAGTGTNGSAIAVDTTDRLFDATITPNSLKFTAGNAHAADLSAAWAATASWTANTIGVLTIDYKNDDGTGVANALGWELTRAVDGRYLDNSNGTWSVARVTNMLDKTFGLKKRLVSTIIDVGSGATTLSLKILQLSGGTASRVDHVYHVQLEKSRFATSRIVTDAATVTRAVATLSYTNTNTNAGRNFPPAAGTMKWEYVAEGMDTNAPSGGPYFLNLTYDASNWFRIYYDAADSKKLKFEVRVGGVTYTAHSVVGAMARGTAYTFAVRWTSAEAELGLAAGTISVFVNGTKGTDAVPGAMPTETASSTLYLGCDGSTNTARGLLRRVFVTPLVWTDQEIAREAPAIAGR